MKKTYVPEIIDNKSISIFGNIADNDRFHIVAINNSKNCRVKVKNEKQAAYLTKELFASSQNNSDIPADLDKINFSENDSKTIRCFVDNSINLDIEIEDDE